MKHGILRGYSALLFLITALGAAASGHAATTAPGFQESVVWSGLDYPTAVRFAPDGRVFVGEKGGVIKVFDDVDDPTPTTFVDISNEVNAYWDRGLIGLAIHPEFPTVPYVYGLYVYDAPPGGTAPTWGDTCASPPGGTVDGCVVSGRLSRFTMGPSGTSTANTVLLKDNWCQQYPSHTVDDLVFGEDGALYVSAGDGASFFFVDWGQGGGSPGSPTPSNPCGDPPVGVGGAPTPPTAEGGALRAQDLQTAGDPVTFDGAVLRIDPLTGGALPDNPLFGGASSEDDRVVAYGLKNPFRLAVRPGSGEIWLGDVGFGMWEMIHRLSQPTSAPIPNFGWPCFEGPSENGAYKYYGLSLCQNLYDNPALVTPAYYVYQHGNVPDQVQCGGGDGASVTGLAFHSGASFPAMYQGAMLFADFTRNCIWAMLEGANGLPDSAQIQTLVASAANPIDLQVAPSGDVYYVDHLGGTIRKVKYIGADQPPTAVLGADVTSGPVPLTVHFSAEGSSDPDQGDTLSYAWDLDGDGALDDSTAVAPTFVYGVPGSYTVTLRVSDDHGAIATATQVIEAANTTPSVTIETPSAGTTWKVGDLVSFSATATDEQDGALPASAFHWSIVVLHCPSDCHEHVLETLDGVDSGTVSVPDHEYPTSLVFRVTADDSMGAHGEASRQIDPRHVAVTVATQPAGYSVALRNTTGPAPLVQQELVGGTPVVAVQSPQTLNGTTYFSFVSWSDAGPASHAVDVGEVPLTLTAQMGLDTDADSVPDVNDNCVNEANPDQSDIDHDGTGDVCDQLKCGAVAPSDPIAWSALSPWVVACAVLSIGRRRRAPRARA